LKIGKSTLTVVIIVLLLIITGFLMSNAITKVWSSWVDYDPPINVKVYLKPDYNYPRIAEYVIIVLVDGARPDIIDKVGGEGFSFLKEEGALFSNAYALPPTYSIPARAAISTGLPHEISGVTSNWYNRGVLDIPSIFSLAKIYGLKTGAIGDSSISMLFKDYLDTYIEIPETSGHMKKSTEEAVKIITSGELPNILWVGFADVDEAGHSHGALSSRYEEAIAEASQSIMKIIEALKLRGMDDKTVLIVLSDHGHLDKGGHGGDELEVRWIYLSIMGPSINKNVILNTDIYYTSIASTIAFILGLPPELISYGPPLSDAFSEDELPSLAMYELGLALNYGYHLKDLFTRLGLNSYVERTDDYLAIFEKIKASNTVDVSSITEYYMKLSRLYEDCKKELISRDAGVRVFSTMLVGLIAWAPTVTLCYFTRKSLWKPLISGFIGFIAFWASFIYLFRYTPTMSSVNSLDSYIESIMASTLISIIVSSVVMVSVISIKDERKTLLSITPILLIISLSSIIILVMGVLYGFIVKFPFPDWSLAYLYYTSLLNEMFLALFNGLMPLLVFIGLTLKTKISKINKAVYESKHCPECGHLNKDVKGEDYSDFGDVV